MYVCVLCRLSVQNLSHLSSFVSTFLFFSPSLGCSVLQLLEPVIWFRYTWLTRRTYNEGRLRILINKTIFSERTFRTFLSYLSFWEMFLLTRRLTISLQQHTIRTFARKFLVYIHADRSIHFLQYAFYFVGTIDFYAIQSERAGNLHAIYAQSISPVKTLAVPNDDDDDWFAGAVTHKVLFRDDTRDLALTVGCGWSRRKRTRLRVRVRALQ